MKRVLLLLVLVVTAAPLGRPATSRAGTNDLILADAPRGAWLATVRADASLSVVEERDGWRRVRLEGWLPATSVPPGVPAVQEPSPRSSRGEESQGGAAAAGTLVRGVLLPSDSGASAGAGLVVLLLSDLEALDREHARAGKECSARLQAIDDRLDRLRSEASRALNSSDNFREAAERNERVKTQIRDAEKERAGGLRDCRQSADALFDRHAVRKTISDARGTFEFEGVPPGHYRVVATEAGGGSPRSWSLDCAAGGTEAVVLDPRRDRSSFEPYWGLH